MNRSIRVLVADDEKNLRDLVVRELSRRGLEVEGVGDGEAALARLRETPYDVVVLDMKMPGLSGLDVARQILERHPGQAVVMCSAYMDRDDVAEAIRIGVAACVDKYQITTLPDVVEAVVGAA